MPILTKRVLLSGFLSFGAILFVSVLPLGAQPNISTVPRPVQESIPAPRQGTYDAVESIDVSPDGKWLATTHLTWQYRPEDSTRVASHARLQVWDADTGERKWNDVREDYANITVRFSPDNNRLLFNKTFLKPGAGHVSEAELRDSATGKRVTTFKAGEVGREALFTPDGKQLVYSIPTGLIWLWDTASGERLPPSTGLPEKEKIVGFSKDSTKVLTSLVQAKNLRVSESKLAMRSWPDLKLLHEMPLGKTWPDKITLSPDGTRAAFVHRLHDLLAAIGEYEVVVWNSESQKLEPLVFPMPRGNTVYSFDFLPDGQTLIGSGRNFVSPEKKGAEFWSWDVESGELLHTFNRDRIFGQDGVATSQLRLKLSADGKSVFVNVDDQVQQRSLADGTLIRSFSEKEKGE